MIRLCIDKDLDAMLRIINDSAAAYKGHIPDDCYHQPYMSRDELSSEIASGIVFCGYEHQGHLVAIMGIQDKGPVVLIRHAYTRTDRRRQGLGSRLLTYLLDQTDKPVLVGTWRDATWAIQFYQKHGFQLASDELKDTLLEKYWSIPERQVETSVVLVDDKYE